jgi:hypothetical protein
LSNDDDDGDDDSEDTDSGLEEEFFATSSSSSVVETTRSKGGTDTLIFEDDKDGQPFLTFLDGDKDGDLEVPFNMSSSKSDRAICCSVLDNTGTAVRRKR